MESIDKRSVAVVLNDVIRNNFERRNNPQYTQAIQDSGLISRLAAFVAAVRPYRIPIFWIRVGGRPDAADVLPPARDGSGRLQQNLVDIGMGYHVAPPITADSWEAQPLEEMGPMAEEDQVIVKPRWDPFTYSDLDLQLRTRRIETILLGGVATNFGVESCARTAHDLGYNVVVVKDCCYNVDEELHRFAIEKILPRFARIRTHDETVAMIR